MTATAEQRSFLLAQKTELERLLDGVRDHPLMAPPLEARLRAIEQELAKIPEEVQPMGRTALFFSRGGVEGSTGIEADLGGDILSAYEQMFEAHARHDQLAGTDAKRFTKRFPKPKLLLTALPRGSVGFELVPREAEDFVVNGVHAETLRNLTKAIYDVAESQASFDKAMERVPIKVLQPLKKFLEVTVEHGTELRMITEGLAEEYRLDMQHLGDGLRRLREAPQDVDTKEMPGTFKGITVDSFYFEFLPDGGKLITGIADTDAIDEEKATHLAQQFTDKPCAASIRVTTIKPLHGKPRATYELLDLREP